MATLVHLRFGVSSRVERVLLHLGRGGVVLLSGLDEHLHPFLELVGVRARFAADLIDVEGATTIVVDLILSLIHI